MPDPCEPDVDDEDVDEFEDPNRDWLYLKFCFEGITSLEDLAASLRSLAAHLDERAAVGWWLETPIDSGHVNLSRHPR